MLIDYILLRLFIGLHMIEDTNYITPFYPHSFSSRDKTEDAIIIAVTFGGEVRRAQKEMYWLGQERVDKFKAIGQKKNIGEFNPIIIQKNNFMELTQETTVS